MQYQTYSGSMSLKMSWDASKTDREQELTKYTYKKGRLEFAFVQFADWCAYPGAAPPDGSYYGFLKGYAYDLYGQRIGVMHCSGGFGGPLADPQVDDTGGPCKGHVRVYDYVDGQVLVERESDDPPLNGGTPERLLSVHTWGPLGVVARRAASLRNGYVENGTFVSYPSPGPPHIMTDYGYLADGQGNIRGLIDQASNTVQLQTFDAFGNVQGETAFAFAKFRVTTGSPPQPPDTCPMVVPPDPQPDCGDYDSRGAIPGPPTCPPQPPEPAERMAGGLYQWRGGEGSITDRPAMDGCRPPPLQASECLPDGDNVHVYGADTRPSTGLIYMRARYYDPAVGRFTQADPLPYGPELVLGQNNRWTYCANDPVNCTDPSGQIYYPALILLVVAGALIGYYFIGGCRGAIIGALLGLAAYFAAAAFAESILGGLGAGATAASAVPLESIAFGAGGAVYQGGTYVGNYVASHVFQRGCEVIVRITVENNGVQSYIWTLKDIIH